MTPSDALTNVVPPIVGIPLAIVVAMAKVHDTCVCGKMAVPCAPGVLDSSRDCYDGALASVFGKGGALFIDSYPLLVLIGVLAAIWAFSAVSSYQNRHNRSDTNLP